MAQHLQKGLCVINPYLKKILSEIQDYNSQKVAELLPWNIIPDTS